MLSNNSENKRLKIALYETLLMTQVNDIIFCKTAFVETE